MRSFKSKEKIVLTTCLVFLLAILAMIYMLWHTGLGIANASVLLAKQVREIKSKWICDNYYDNDTIIEPASTCKNFLRKDTLE
jgi:hypothetical protein